MSSEKHWIGVWLDGCLAKKTEKTGILGIGEPLVPMVQQVKEWLREGKTVKIVTSRVYGDNKIAKEMVRQWSISTFGLELEATACIDRKMLTLWSCNCVRVEFNSGEPMFGSR